MTNKQMPDQITNPISPSPIHQHRTVYWIIAVVVMLAVAGGTLIAIKNFNTEQDVNSIQIPAECTNHGGSALACSAARSGKKLATSTLSSTQANSASSTPSLVLTGGTTSTSSIEGWKIYSNARYGFQFTFPTNYTLVEQMDPNAGFHIQITTPNSQKISADTGGEDGDGIIIVPSTQHPGYFSGGILPEPIQFTQDYFSSQAVADYSNEFIAKLLINGHTAFQLRHTEMASEKYTIFQNADKTFFTIQQSFIAASDPTKNSMQPYDTIVASIKFTK